MDLSKKKYLGYSYLIRREILRLVFFFTNSMLFPNLPLLLYTVKHIASYNKPLSHDFYSTADSTSQGTFLF